MVQLLFLITSLIFNGIMFFHFKKSRNNSLTIGVSPLTILYPLLIILKVLEYLWVASQVISLSGNIEINPGPKSNALNRCFSKCHWNLNSISAHMFTKVSLLSAYISVHKFDIICPSETHLNPKSHLMTKIWKYLDTILSEKITPLTVNVMEPVFIIKGCSHLIELILDTKTIHL